MAELTDDLFRSCRASSWGKGGEAKRTERFTAAFGKGALYPDYEGFMRKDNTFRAPDVTTVTDGNGFVWVLGVNDRDSRNRALVNWKEGVSVSTQPGGFGYDGWMYFGLPKGVTVPDSLDVKATPTRNDAGHHSIRCLNRMRKDAYEGALDTLARAAVEAAVRDAKQLLFFSA